MAENLPDFIASAKPVPLAARGPWYKNTAPTYAGIFLWFMFWDSMPVNGLPGGGLGSALIGMHDAQALRNPGAAALMRRGCAWIAGLTPEPAP